MASTSSSSTKDSKPSGKSMAFLDLHDFTNMATTTIQSYSPPDPSEPISSGFIDSFRRAKNSAFMSDNSSITGHVYNVKRANNNTAHSPLNRILKGRHLQMIAIGGSIGTGLFIGTGQALAQAGPAPMLIAFVILGMVLYCTLQALGEMAVLFPVAGSFSAFATRFMDPAWGFAMGWNYAMNWLVVLPLEIIAAVSTLEFWDTHIPRAVAVTIFLAAIVAINLCSVKAYGEAEFCLSALKVAAVIGFILLGIIIDCAGGQNQGYIGGRYWVNPGAFQSGFKGFCNVLVTASFAFSGTELVGLAAAETHNPMKSIPTAVKQVFWRIFLFYVVSVLIVGLIVPSNNVALNGSTALASPFVIAILDAGLVGLDSVMNAVILISVLSVANSSLFGSSRTLAALAEQGQAPACLNYIDRKGRPLVALVVSLFIGLLSYLGVKDDTTTIFNWLLALSALASIYTWLTICFCHIRFRKAWAMQGHHLSELSYRSPIGVVGSWFGVIALILVLIAQLWVAIDPIGDEDSSQWSITDRVSNFFQAYMAFPIVAVCYLGFKFWFKTKWVRFDQIDLRTGKLDGGLARFLGPGKEERDTWPRWKKVYWMLC